MISTFQISKKLTDKNEGDTPITFNGLQSV